MTREEILSLSYTDFISLLKEENRPSGGKQTIRLIAQNAFVTPNKKVLEIGCTNGFSSIELHRVTDCEVIGIDINENSVKNASQRVLDYKLNPEKIKFVVASAEKMPFDDDSFDLIICGNALSFIQDKTSAMKEILRCLKPSGFLSMVPIWYNQEPDKTVTEAVSGVLGFNILCTYKQDWIKFIQKNSLELYYNKDFSFDNQTDESINQYIDSFFRQKPQLNVLESDVQECIKERWRNIINIFHSNLKQTSFSVMLMRKNPVEEEVELFLAHEKEVGDR